MCFLGVWKREKTRREAGPRAKLSKIPFFFLFEKCLELFIAPSAFFEATALGGLLMALQGSPASKGP